MASYILQKDLPDVKAGAEYISYKNSCEEDMYHHVHGNNNRSFFRAELVENNSEWFKLKEEKIIVTAIYLGKDAILPEQIKAITFITNREVSEDFIFSKYDAITKAIEFVLNNQIK